MAGQTGPPFAAISGQERHLPKILTATVPLPCFCRDSFRFWKHRISPNFSTNMASSRLHKLHREKMQSMKKKSLKCFKLQIYPNFSKTQVVSLISFFSSARSWSALLSFDLRSLEQDIGNTPLGEHHLVQAETTLQLTECLHESCLHECLHGQL